jgi:hypothetical protein
MGVGIFTYKKFKRGVVGRVDALKTIVDGGKHGSNKEG